MSFSVGAFGPMAHYIGATRINAVTGRTVTGNLCNFWVIPNSGKGGGLYFLVEAPAFMRGKE